MSMQRNKCVSGYWWEKQINWWIWGKINVVFMQSNQPIPLKFCLQQITHQITCYVVWRYSDAIQEMNPLIFKLMLSHVESNPLLAITAWLWESFPGVHTKWNYIQVLNSPSCLKSVEFKQAKPNAQRVLFIQLTASHWQRHFKITTLENEWN